MTSPAPEATVHLTVAVAPVVEPAPPRVTSHQVRVVDGRFCSAECTCGWRSAGRRHRTTVRAEARDHALLYADGRILTVADEA